MSKEDIIRAWKDPEYRDNLSEEQRSLLPDNPAGIIELSDEQAQAVIGGLRNIPSKRTKRTITPWSWCIPRTFFYCPHNPRFPRP